MSSLQLVNYHLQRGSSFYEQNKYEQAIQVFDKALQIEPKNADVLKSKALALFELDNYQECLQCFKKCMKIDKINDAIYLLIIGDCYFYQEKYTQAYSYYQKLQKKNPKSSQPYIRKGKALMAQNKHKEAKEQFQQALIFTKQHPIALFLIGTCYFFQKKYQKAIYYINQAILNNRNCTQFYLFKGNAHYSINQFQLAKLCYEQALQMDSNDLDVRSCLILVNCRLKSKQCEAYNCLDQSQSRLEIF